MRATDHPEAARPDDRLLALFASVHHVLAAEAALRRTGVWCDVVPTPREFSSDCGVSLVVRAEEREAALAVCSSLPHPPLALHPFPPGGPSGTAGETT